MKNNATISARNKWSLKHFVILKKYEAGIILEGWEVKSIRINPINIDKSFIMYSNNKLMLIGSIITPVITISTHNKSNKKRMRELLLHKSELINLTQVKNHIGVTIIPLLVYWKNNKIKVEMAIVKSIPNYKVNKKKQCTYNNMVKI